MNEKTSPGLKLAKTALYDTMMLGFRCDDDDGHDDDDDNDHEDVDHDDEHVDGVHVVVVVDVVVDDDHADCFQTHIRGW